MSSIDQARVPRPVGLGREQIDGDIGDGMIIPTT
jgi:hypothetical protein